MAEAQEDINIQKPVKAQAAGKKKAAATRPPAADVDKKSPEQSTPQATAKAAETRAYESTDLNTKGDGDNVQLLFDKYEFGGVIVRDQSLVNYVNLIPRSYPNIFGRRKNHAYYVAHINIVERLVNKLMRGGTGGKVGGKVIRTEGRLQGRKTKTVHVVEKAFDIIYQQTKKNPIQVLVNALENAAPIEDTTRVRYGGIVYNVAVDISSERRLNIALKNIALAGIAGSFRNRRTISDALASEIIVAANKDPNSYAIKKKVDAERIARSSR
jgi:small subunit ribosomal protein S7